MQQVVPHKRNLEFAKVLFPCKTCKGVDLALSLHNVSRVSAPIWQAGLSRNSSISDNALSMAKFA